MARSKVSLTQILTLPHCCRILTHQLVCARETSVFDIRKVSNILHGHLRHHIKAGEAFTGEILLVLAHFYGIQPLIDGAERGEIWSAAIKQS